MQAKYNRQLKNGFEFNHLIPKAEVATTTVRKNADVNHTVAFIPKVVLQTLQHTSQLAPLLLADTVHDTCKNIWQFVYNHIAYRKDKEGYEQIRSPARTWNDRKEGVDCDCYTTFISSILTNLQIPHTFRITKYNRPQFQHIYPIVPTGNGKYITIDCVVDKFNYEEPFTQKQDTKMDLEYLNGLDGEEIIFADSTNIDATDLIGNEEMLLGELGRRRHANNSPSIRGKPKILNKVLHTVNKANPATVLLRNGVLASMKLNLFGVAQKLKWAYLSDAEATKRNIIPSKFTKLKAVRAKLESIFFGAGGQPENLKNAILRGKGNKGNEVSGFGELNEYSSLSELLGYEYDGIDGLGEPATGAAIASASAVIGAIAALMKSIGNIFPAKNAEGASDFAENSAEKSPTSEVAISESKTVPPSITAEGKANPESNVAPSTNENGNAEIALKVADGNGAENADAKTPTNENGMWEKNKKWLKPTLIGVGSLGVIYLGYKAMSGGATAKPTTAKTKSLNGVRRRRKPKPKTTTTHKRKKIIKKQSLFN
jgi:hypothetical protein